MRKDNWSSLSLGYLSHQKLIKKKKMNYMMICSASSKTSSLGTTQTQIRRSSVEIAKNSGTWHASVLTNTKDSAVYFVVKTLMTHSIATKSYVSSAIKPVTLRVSVRKRMFRSASYAIKQATLSYAASRFGTTRKSKVKRVGIQTKISMTSSRDASNVERVATSNVQRRAGVKKGT